MKVKLQCPQSFTGREPSLSFKSVRGNFCITMASSFLLLLLFFIIFIALQWLLKRIVTKPKIFIS